VDVKIEAVKSLSGFIKNVSA